MSKERTFHGKIQNINGLHKFVPDAQKLWQTMLNKLKEGQICVVYFKICKRIRSLPQNNLYHLYLSVIEAETGEDHDDLHRFFKKEFLPHEIKQKWGRTFEKLTSTTDLSVDEFMDYLSKIERLTEIPIPDTQSFVRERDSAPML